MYKVYIDGALLWESGANDANSALLSPKLNLSVDSTGAFTFTLLPNHPKYDNVSRVKSIVTVYQDEDELFRGRVVSDEKDFYNQKNITCEGDTAFLLDSIQRPYSYEGTATGFFTQLITNHNAQVDNDKKFTIGNITIDDAQTAVKTSDTAYNDTSSVIANKLTGVFGGYLKTRTVSGTRYIDWLKEYGADNTQSIAFAVNLLDLKNKVDTNDLFTVLIPLGAEGMGTSSKNAPLTVASVNDNKDYIENAAGIALFGRIEKTQTWSDVKTAAELLTKGTAYLAKGVEGQTITLKAIDMHFTDGDIQKIKCGDKVSISSDPHGIASEMPCASINIDMLNPEKTEYVFGIRPKTLTDNVIETERKSGGGGGGRKPVEEEIQEIIAWAYAQADEESARYLITTGQLNTLTNDLNEANIALDGINATILLKADSSVMDALGTRLSSAELSLDGINGTISTKVSKNGVISAINQSAESITISASKINLEGYVTASQLSALNAHVGDLEADIADITLGFAESFVTKALAVTSGADIKTLRLNGSTLATAQKKLVTSVDVNVSTKSGVWGYNNGAWTGQLVTGVTCTNHYFTVNYITYS